MIPRFLLPVFVALLLGAHPAWAQHGAHEHAPSPEFDNKTALKISQDAIGRNLGDYRLRDRAGKPVRLADYRGRPLVVSLIYTSCYHICPTTTRYLAKVVRTAQAALGPDRFRVVTIGFDTPNDTTEAMRVFARQQDVDDIDGWEFLSADADTIAALARDLGFIYFRSPKGFDHLIQATVVDAEGKIYRQVYGTSFDTPLLVEPLKALVFGGTPDEPVLSHLLNRVRLFCTTYDPSTDSYRFDYSLFVGMGIGAIIILLIVVYLVREARRARRA